MRKAANFSVINRNIVFTATGPIFNAFFPLNMPKIPFATGAYPCSKAWLTRSLSLTVGIKLANGWERNVKHMRSCSNHLKPLSPDMGKVRIIPARTKYGPDFHGLVWGFRLNWQCEFEEALHPHREGLDCFSQVARLVKTFKKNWIRAKFVILTINLDFYGKRRHYAHVLFRITTDYGFKTVSSTYHHENLEQDSKEKSRFKMNRIGRRHDAFWVPAELVRNLRPWPSIQAMISGRIEHLDFVVESSGSLVHFNTEEE